MQLHLIYGLIVQIFESLRYYDLLFMNDYGLRLNVDAIFIYLSPITHYLFGQPELVEGWQHMIQGFDSLNLTKIESRKYLTKMENSI